jgi:hypothetical protein
MVASAPPRASRRPDLGDYDIKSIALDRSGKVS